MSGIRLADIPDIDEICKLGSELLEQSVYADIKPDESKYRMFVAGLMGHKQGSVFLIVDDDDKPQGFLFGLIDDLFFSQSRCATDVAFFVRDGYRHLVPALLKRFMTWAKAKPKVVYIALGISSGTGDPERIGKVYESFGLSKVGGIYFMGVQ